MVLHSTANHHILVITIPPLFMEMYNPGNFTCTKCDYPYGCANTDKVDCERGEGALKYLTFSMGYIFLCNVIIVTFVSMLVYEIFKQERKTDRYLSPGQERRRTNTKKDHTTGPPLHWGVHLGILSFLLYSRQLCRRQHIPP